MTAIAISSQRSFHEARLNKVAEVIVFRTAGGRIAPVIPDILSLDSFLGHGSLQQLLVVHHTDCGASHFTDSGVRADICSRNPGHEHEVQNWPAIAFNDVDKSVREDVEIVRQNPLVSDAFKRGTKGLVWDVKTGELREIV